MLVFNGTTINDEWLNENNDISFFYSGPVTLSREVNKVIYTLHCERRVGVRT